MPRTGQAPRLDGLILWSARWKIVGRIQTTIAKVPFAVLRAGGHFGQFFTSGSVTSRGLSTDGSPPDDLQVYREVSQSSPGAVRISGSCASRFVAPAIAHLNGTDFPSKFVEMATRGHRSNGGQFTITLIGCTPRD
jgi:hypothetical protein